MRYEIGDVVGPILSRPYQFPKCAKRLAWHNQSFFKEWGVSARSDIRLWQISYSCSPVTSTKSHRSAASLDAHLHQSIISVDHTLKSDPFHRSSSRAYLSIPITRRSAPPWSNISLHWALHHGAIVHAHSRTNCPTLKACRVEIVISPSLVVDFTCDFCSCRPASGLRCRGSGWR